MAYRLHRLKGERFVDDNGTPYSGGVFTYFQESTVTPLTVYKDDAGATPWGVSVALSAAGLLTDAVYVGEDDFKEVFTPPSETGEATRTQDNIPGAVPPPDVESARPITPVDLSADAVVTMVDGDLGTVKLLNTTANSITFVLLPPSSVANGERVTVRKSAAANILTLSGAINGRTRYLILGKDDAVTLVSNGVDQWVAVSHVRTGLIEGALGQPVRVLDRLTAPPGSSTPGGWYLINGSPSGAWVSFSQHDLVQDDGIGGWFRMTPEAGWIVYVVDESVYSGFMGGAWADLSNAVAPTPGVQGHIQVQYQAADGTGGGAVGANNNTWYTRALNTVVKAGSGTLAGVTLSSNQLLNVPAGTYRWSAQLAFGAVGNGQSRLRGATAGIISYLVNSISGGTAVGSGEFTLPVADTLYLENTVGSDANLGGAAGNATGVSGQVEIHGNFELTDIAMLQGPRGLQGPAGRVSNNSYTVAGLAALTPSVGDCAFATNGRKNGEGGGSGTGVLVFYDGTAWRACDTGATVAA